LTAGVYQGAVNFSFTGSAAQTVNVTLIVPAAPTGALRSHDTTTCSGGKLVPTPTGLVNNFSTAAGWPAQLAIRLYDSCGNAVSTSQIEASFSNGDPGLALTLVNASTGLYSGTWTPLTAAQQMTITFGVTASGYSAVSSEITGAVSPNAVPILTPNGTGDVFHPQTGAALAPGNIVQIYGTGLASQIGAANALPLPTTVSGTSITIGGIQAPLYYVSPTQINAQIPYELAAGNQYQLVVNTNGALSTPQTLQLSKAAPQVLQYSSGSVVAQHLDGSLVSATSPAAPGEDLVIYLSGLGAVNIPVADGAASPSNPPAQVVDTPTLTLNGSSVKVLFAGLTPTLAGLYQIDFVVPAGLNTGSYTLVIAQDGSATNQTLLPVKGQ
jgi:uncharacterized protein (TIGR03437 family)